MTSLGRKSKKVERHVYVELMHFPAQQKQYNIVKQLCVCVWVCVWVCGCVWECVSVSEYECECVWVCVYVCEYVCVCVSVCVWVCVFHSVIWLFVTPWTAACQAPLSMVFSRQEYWSGLLCPLPGDLHNPEIEPVSHIAGGFFTIRAKATILP